MRKIIQNESATLYLDVSLTRLTGLVVDARAGTFVLNVVVSTKKTGINLTRRPHPSQLHDEE